LNLVVIGAGASAWYCTKRLLDEKYVVAAYITLTDDLAKHKSTYKSIDDLAASFSFPVIKVADINEANVVQTIKELKPDLIISMGWSQIIGRDILSIPVLGTIGTHISLLPKYRGHSPLNWGIIMGYKEWGITLFYLEERVDTGEIIAQKIFPIGARDDAQTLYSQATYYGIDLLIDALIKIKEGTLKTIKQPILPERPLSKRKPEDGLIDWTSNGIEILNLIRALAKPFPGAYCYLNGKKLFIWKARLFEKEQASNIHSSRKSGEILDVISGLGVLVATQNTPVIIERISIENDLDIWSDSFFTQREIGCTLNS
jgi:methionyl-tRNA formyltransferase